jgi:hypothetical protein
MPIVKENARVKVKDAETRDVGETGPRANPIDSAQGSSPDAKKRA